MNQVMLATLMVSLGNHKNAEVDVSMLRHMILNSIRMNYVKFKATYGEMIICTDGSNYWRRDYFPQYKAGRRKAKAESEMDWKTIFEAFDTIRAEIKEFMPYKILQFNRAEADDIIATIVHEEGRLLNTGEPILILSGDKDFIQLHSYSNVKQYDPTRKKYIQNSSPEQYLREHIIKGDAGDGVPNILSDDDTFVTGKRQAPITKKRLTKYLELEPSEMETSVERNYHRNKMMIDLSQVEESIKEKILEGYREPNTKDRSKLINYFMKNKLKMLTERLSDF